MCKRMIPNKSLFKNTNKETVTIKDKTEWTINHLWTKLKENALNKSIEYSKFSTLLVDGKFEPQMCSAFGSSHAWWFIKIKIFSNLLLEHKM
jgi:murein endopeptidase